MSGAFPPLGFIRLDRQMTIGCGKETTARYKLIEFLRIVMMRCQFPNNHGLYAVLNNATYDVAKKNFADIKTGIRVTCSNEEKGQLYAWIFSVILQPVLSGSCKDNKFPPKDKKPPGGASALLVYRAESWVTRSKYNQLHVGMAS